MDTPSATGAWLLLLTGAVCAALGLAAWISRESYPAFIRAIGGPDASFRESRWIPLLLFAAGVAWFLTGVLQIVPYPHGTRPYAVVILAVVLHPAGAVVLVATLLWVAFLRRFRS